MADRRESELDLSETEKAAALDDLMHAFRDEYWDITDDWVTIDGSNSVSDETIRVLRLMRAGVHGRKIVEEPDD